MPTPRLVAALTERLRELETSGRLKGPETVISGVLPATDGRGPRYLLDGHGGKPFLRMNSNGYLGMALRDAVRDAEERATRRFGAGPGAVRFISGTWTPHVELERRLAGFHGREAAMLFSSAYATVMGTIPPLVTQSTAVISDELNHNCIINATALARPRRKMIYRHLDLGHLEQQLAEAARDCTRAMVVTDGVFSMRGDHAPIDHLLDIVQRHDERFDENVILVVDDSHGVGAFGKTGRGSEEVCGSAKADILIGTLGKAFGVNGGYVVTSAAIVRYLRETSPFYIYSNPITPSEAAASIAALSIVDSPEGAGLLTHLQAMTLRFRSGLERLGLESLTGFHPVVPLMVRDTKRTSALVAHLREAGILATGLNYPVVPQGDQEIRFQISADHTPKDIDEALAALAAFRE